MKRSALDLEASKVILADLIIVRSEMELYKLRQQGIRTHRRELLLTPWHHTGDRSRFEQESFLFGQRNNTTRFHIIQQRPNRSQPNCATVGEFFRLLTHALYTERLNAMNL